MIHMYEIALLVHLAGCFRAYSMVMRKALIYSRRKNRVLLLLLNIQSELCLLSIVWFRWLAINLINI
jgi:hypothetical protein